MNVGGMSGQLQAAGQLSSKVNFLVGKATLDSDGFPHRFYECDIGRGQKLGWGPFLTNALSATEIAYEAAARDIDLRPLNQRFWRDSVSIRGYLADLINNSVQPEFTTMEVEDGSLVNIHVQKNVNLPNLRLSDEEIEQRVALEGLEDQYHAMLESPGNVGALIDEFLGMSGDKIGSMVSGIGLAEYLNDPVLRMRFLASRVAIKLRDGTPTEVDVDPVFSLDELPQFEAIPQDVWNSLYKFYEGVHNSPNFSCDFLSEMFASYFIIKDLRIVKSVTGP